MLNYLIITSERTLIWLLKQTKKIERINVDFLLTIIKTQFLKFYQYIKVFFSAWLYLWVQRPRKRRIYEKREHEIFHCEKKKLFDSVVLFFSPYKCLWKTRCNAEKKNISPKKWWSSAIQSSLIQVCVENHIHSSAICLK